MVSYRTIRRDYQIHNLNELTLADHYAMLWSPLFTLAFIKTSVTPNVLTLLMMASGILGAALFALPHLACKLCGLVFLHLWYVMDCCDGEVARITKQFSKFGTEFDFTAHVINHPLFNLAFVYSLICMGRYNTWFLLWVSIVSISSELVTRNMISFTQIFRLKMVPGTSRSTARSSKAIFVYCFNIFASYPTFVLVFPLAYLADYLFGTSIAYYYFLAQAALGSLMAIWTSYKWVRVMMNA